MNTVVNQLLDVDKEARKILDSAQQYYDKTLEEIISEKKTMMSKYEIKEKQHLEDVKNSEDANMQAETINIKERYSRFTDSLNKTFEDLHTKWEDELFKKCTGR